MTSVSGSGSGTPAPMEPINILIVDDRRENLMALRSVLEPSPHRIIEAMSGNEALQIALREKIGLILLDVVMPDLDGFEVAAHLKQIERTRNIPIIFLTALATEIEQFDRAFALGAVDYLTKPLDREVVRRRVAVFTELVQQREARERELKRESDMRAAQLRLASDRRYRRLVEGFNNAIGWAIDDTGRLIFISRQGSRILGHDVDSLVRPSYFIERVHPDDREAVAAMLARCRAERRELSCIHRMIAADSVSDVWLFTCVSCELSDSGRHELHGLSTDITSVKRAEETQALLAEIGATLVQSFDVAAVMPQVARRLTSSVCDWCMIDEYSDEGELRVLGAAHVLKGHDMDALIPRVRRCDRSVGAGAVADGAPAEVAPSIRDAAWFASRSGVPVNVVERLGAESCMFVPINVREGPPAVLTLVSSSRRKMGPAELDVAAEVCSRIALALESARQYRLARRAIAAREDLLSVVSHDLRTPLNAIATGGRELEAKAANAAAAAPAGVVTDDRDARVVRSILRSTEHMKRLIGDLLDVAQIDAGQLRIEERPTSTAAIVAQVLQSFEGVARDKNVSLAATPGDIPVLCDHDRVVQVLSNLVGNALKFTPAGGTITVDVTANDNGIVHFTVRDTGRGIAPDELAEIWSRFWRRPKQDGGGVGLGLSIAKSLVDAHRGRIWVDSKVGEGSAFTFTLPASPSSVREAAPATPA